MWLGTPFPQLHPLFQVDIVFFNEPEDCVSTKTGCDWTKLGVGASDSMGNLRWCCNEDASDLGFCDATKQYGRLIVDQSTFKGEHRFISVPPTGPVKQGIREGRFNVKKLTGKYTMVVAK